MMNRHRKAAHRNRFYAGKDKPTILFRERFDMEAGDPAACLICFVREGKEDKVWFGLYEGAQILPLQGEYEQIAREMAGEAWESGVAASIPTPLRTVLSRDMYLRYRDEYVPGEAEADDDEEVYGGARRKQLKRWQFVLLLIAASSLLSLAAGTRLVWSSFFLLNGTYISQMIAARIFFAWAIPLTLLLGFLYQGPRDVFTVLMFAISPLAIRAISLLRNFSLIVMWICYLLVVSILVIMFFRCRRLGEPRREAIASGILFGTCALMLAFTVINVVDAWVPQVLNREVKAPEAAAEKESHRISEETLTFLNSDAFASTSAERKGQVLREIAEDMAEALGIDCPRILIDAMGDGNYDAYFQWEDYSIYLWKPALERADASRAAEMILHELYHAYQQAIIHSTAINWDDPDVKELAYFRKVDQWRKEDENYIGTDRWESNLEEYYEQSLETDAYKFGQLYVSDYVFSEAEGEPTEKPEDKQ